MHRYEELEKIYYKKLFFKLFFYFVFFFVIFIGSFLFFKYIQSPEKKALHNKQKTTVERNNTEFNKTVINKKLSQNKAETIVKAKKGYKEKNSNKNMHNVKKDNQELKFILPNIDFIKEPKIVKTKNDNNISKTKNISKPNKLENTNKINKKDNEKIKEISIGESNANLKTLIKEYQLNKDYNVAMTIAQIYFQQNNLKKAQIWALNANSLNPSKPDSWLLFTDILVKQHKIQKAKNLLKAYIDSYGNNDIIEEKLRSLNGE